MTDAPACGNCRHFFNTSPAIESALPGLAALSSGYASVRADDGVCCLHDRYLAADSVCGRHAGRPTHQTSSYRVPESLE
ncbi:MAG TPA: hypothetical protein VKP66_03370 [Steroidobacteraceae bacterium]|nr:hypothetical protein [Steroidobacteraceae bacterium]